MQCGENWLDTQVLYLGPINHGGQFGGGNFQLMENTLGKATPAIKGIKQLSLGLGNSGEFCPFPDRSTGLSDK